MKDKIKLLSIAAVFVLLICAGYSILSFKQTDLQSILKKESSKKDLFIDYYDSNYLMIDSFEYEVLKNNLIHTKCIEKGNAPASSYHGVISWYNKFNVAGCNVTKVTIGFKVIDPEIDLSNITEILSLHEE